MGLTKNEHWICRSKMAGLPVKLQLIGCLSAFCSMTCHFPFPLLMREILNFVFAIAKSVYVIFWQTDSLY